MFQIMCLYICSEMNGQNRYQKNNPFTYVVCLKKKKWAHVIYPPKWEANNKVEGLEEQYSSSRTASEDHKGIGNY